MAANVHYMRDSQIFSSQSLTFIHAEYGTAKKGALGLPSISCKNSQVCLVYIKSLFGIPKNP